MTPIYGIDLGTTYTKCALVRPTDSQLEVFALDKDRPDSPQNTLRMLRSAVTVMVFPDGRKGAYVGARSLLELEQWSDGDPEIQRFEESKIWIGEKPPESDEEAPPWPFAPHDWKYRPEDIGALVLRKVKKEVESRGLAPMNRVVVTHPQYFTDTRRKATRQAVEIAGLELVDTLTEPDAAALAFGATASPGRYMIFDFGGGTLDVTVADISGKGNVRVQVLATEGMKAAGRDFDRTIFGMMVDAYREAYPEFDPFFLDSKTKQAWMRDAEQAKRRLNSEDQPAVRLKFACSNERFSGQSKRLEITRERFFRESEHMVTDAIHCAEKALVDAKIRWPDLAGVLCVGGSSRLLNVLEALNAASGNKVRTGVDADTAVAEGAAIYAHDLSKRTAVASDTAPQLPRARKAVADSMKVPDEVRLSGALARGLGIKAFSQRQRRDVIVTLLPKGRAIPCDEKKPFRTTEENQSSIVVDLYEGEDVDPDNCERVGRVELSGVPPGPSGQAVEVSIVIEANGTKHLIAKVGDVKREAVIQFDPDRVIGQGEIEKRRAFIGALVVV